MPDMIDLSTVTILNSPDIHTWPATTDITRLELRPSGVHVEFTKKDGAGRWPDIPFGDPSQGGTLQYTLWIVLQVAGLWLAAGCIEYWFGLDESGGPVTDYAKNWYYDPNRWPGMAGHQPALMERVGFLVTSGDARHGDDGVGLHERSNVVAINFPAAEGATYTFPPFSTEPAQPPTPQPPVPPTVQPPAPPVITPGELGDTDGHIERFIAAVESLVVSVEIMARAAVAIEAAVEKVARDGARVHV